MSPTPRTDAIREKINESDDCHAEDICTALDFAEKLELDDAALRKELAEVTAAFQAVCDHEWEHVDDSFDHEYGTEVIRYQRCPKCGKTSEADDGPDDQ